jgi:MFS family permease
LGRAIRTRTGVLIVSSAIQAAAVVGGGVLGLGVTAGAAAHGVPARFLVVVALYLIYGVALGAMGPVKQGYLNAHIPSAQRATIISLDALFADAGGVVGQSGWGYLAKVRSIGEAWMYAGATLLMGAPLYWMARRNDKDLDKFGSH